MPTNTPVALPVSESGAMPARSSASQLTSSTSRCCGSIVTASRGEMPKNCGIELVDLVEEARRTRSCPSPSRPRSMPPASAMARRSAGYSLTTSRPSRSSSQNASGDVAPPGKRQLIPMMAIGSRAACSTRSSFACMSSSACKRVLQQRTAFGRRFGVRHGTASWAMGSASGRRVGGHRDPAPIAASPAAPTAARPGRPRSDRRSSGPSRGRVRRRPRCSVARRFVRRPRRRASATRKPARARDVRVVEREGGGQVRADGHLDAALQLDATSASPCPSRTGPGRRRSSRPAGCPSAPATCRAGSRPRAPRRSPGAAAASCAASSGCACARCDGTRRLPGRRRGTGTAGRRRAS